MSLGLAVSCCWQGAGQNTHIGSHIHCEAVEQAAGQGSGGVTAGAGVCRATGLQACDACTLALTLQALAPAPALGCTPSPLATPSPTPYHRRSWTQCHLGRNAQGRCAVQGCVTASAAHAPAHFSRTRRQPGTLIPRVFFSLCLPGLQSAQPCTTWCRDQEMRSHRAGGSTISRASRL